MGRLSSGKTTSRGTSRIVEKPSGFGWAHSLIQLKENSGYDLYYDVLVGERKGVKNLIAEQMSDLKTPERAIKFAFDQGIGFVPYGGYGMEAVRAWKKRNNSPTRAAAAR